MKTLRIIFISIIALLFINSCRTTKVIEKEVPIETIRTEYIYLNLLDSIFVHDSVYEHDSVFIMQKGDTVFKYQNKTKYKYLTNTKYRDSILVVTKTDSIPVVVKVKDVVKVNEFNWWQKTCMIIGGVTIIILLSLIGIKIFKK